MGGGPSRDSWVLFGPGAAGISKGVGVVFKVPAGTSSRTVGVRLNAHLTCDGTPKSAADSGEGATVQLLDVQKVPRSVSSFS